MALERATLTNTVTQQPVEVLLRRRIPIVSGRNIEHCVPVELIEKPRVEYLRGPLRAKKVIRHHSLERRQVRTPDIASGLSHQPLFEREYSQQRLDQPTA